MPVTYTRELLATAAAAATSLDEMLTALGREPDKDRRKYLRRKLTAYAIDTSHFRPTGSVYTRELLEVAVAACQSVAGVEQLLVQRPWDAERLPGARIGQALAELGRPEQCEGCGIGPQWRSRPLTLEVDHINGDWSDNRPDNLRLLCPNCHAVTDTYCGRDKNRRARSAPGYDQDGTTTRNCSVPAPGKPLD
ncbi:HNH endonuclease signature motif containing protein [Kitasatospora sp. NPDC091207]|uniref:HNH endonuclease signature motif containing protein n=1 Tax=Kitasatospora sp. NPDC091207 TaxID=3364083 RepID=UPI003803E80D